MNCSDRGSSLSEGELWRRQRGAIQPAFYRDRIATYAESMTAHAERTVERWDHGAMYDIEGEMRDLTLRILVESMFGGEIDYEKRGIREMTRRLQVPGRPAMQPIANVVPSRCRSRCGGGTMRRSRASIRSSTS